MWSFQCRRALDSPLSALGAVLSMVCQAHLIMMPRTPVGNQDDFSATSLIARKGCVQHPERIPLGAWRSVEKRKILPTPAAKWHSHHAQYNKKDQHAYL